MVSYKIIGWNMSGEYLTMLTPKLSLEYILEKCHSDLLTIGIEQGEMSTIDITLKWKNKFYNFCCLNKNYTNTTGIITACIIFI